MNDNKPKYQKLKEYMKKCTGIVCYNDQIGLWLIDIILEKGISIPGRLSLVSFDDSDLAVASEIKLTTVAHPKDKLGMEAANTMLKLLSEPGMNLQVKMKPNLVKRNTTGRQNNAEEQERRSYHAEEVFYRSRLWNPIRQSGSCRTGYRKRNCRCSKGISTWCNGRISS